MNKTILLLMLFASLSLAAQQPSNLNKIKPDRSEAKMKAVDLGGILDDYDYKNDVSVDEYLSTVSEGDSIGFSVYDLQSNNSMQRRLHLEEDGTLHAVWTYGLFDDAFPGRGTGYNVRTDGVWGDIPNERLEDQRVGWPEVGVTASGRVYSITHSANDGMHFVYKDAGQTDWISNIVPNDAEAIWPRTAANGDTIYAIISRQTAFGGLPNGLAFHRSFDGGDNWEGPIVLDMLLDDYGGVTVDCYDIDAAGGAVAFVLGGYGRQNIVYKSTNHGDDWDRIAIAETTAPLIEGGGTAVEQFDPANLAENVSLVVDDEGKVHVAGAWVFNFTTGPNTAPSFIVDRGGIMYWTEGMNGFELIGNTVAQDWDGNASNEYDAIDQATGAVVDLDVGWRFYSNVPIAQPSISVDEEGNPFIAYSSVVDAHFHNTDLDDVEKYFREVFVVKGNNSGDVTAWEGPYNVSNDENTEDVFPSLPNRIYNGEVNILYNSDSEAGMAWGEQQAWQINSFKIVTIDTADIVSPDYIAENNGPELDIFWTAFGTTQGCALAASDIPGVTAWDFPDGDLTEAIVFPEIDFNTVSTDQEIIFTVTDSDGNEVQDTMLFSVVEDVTPPEITLLCPDGTPGCANQVFIVDDLTVYDDPGYTFFDDSACPGLDASAVTVTGSVDVTTIDTYTLTYEASDFAGNPTTVTRTVQIIAIDDIPPTITVTAPDGSEIVDGGTYVFEADASIDEIPFVIEALDDVVIGVEYSIEYGANGEPQPDMLGDYTVTVTSTDGFNITEVTYVVSVVDTTPPSITLLGGADTEYSFCQGDGMLIELAFNSDDNLTANPTLNSSEDIPFDQTGTYTASYSFTDDAGNQSESIDITYIVNNDVDCWALGINDIAFGNAITISPNPAKDIATITVNGNYQNLAVLLTDIQGKEILTLNNQNGIIRLDLSKMAAGVYYAKVKTEDATAVKKLIIE